ncbi:PTS sugar transporter subunit IIC [Enterococcus durans]|uniref:PTS sugar transporter subunit IIC n=1 Tax=Enterococcus durans TaxID=53345 RepID=A0A5N0YPV1_9ENTE|nr:MULTISPECIES: PTS transporter subunit IIC [Enterococcus]KAA9177732.1 PTS sugar transporter subunit IIC [Enterococcus durans]KAA9183471.1 PTS sugar transporter subunit IIC [Enterococcus durans]KAA9184702.1 PTS sugar transporter subunit IIC [Enterococcus durans]KAA9189424.1 PTS sugar transporter subunit IIC [Enterococcus durans]KAA9191747.1 PTS sugar transporter subunit IIC [Enterococcus durans]
MIVINYIMSLGASVMMPIIFTIFGILLGLGVSKSLRSGISVGIGFVGLSVVTKLLADNLGPAVNRMVELYGLNLKVLDIGWPAAAAVAYGTEVGAIVIPLGLLVNVVMLLTKTTNTVNIDLWNYWHFAFIGSIVSIATNSFLWGLFSVVIAVAITLVGADRSQNQVEHFYGDKMKGISIPQAFCIGFIPFAIITNWIIEKIPGLNKVDLDAKKLQEKFGIVGEPLFLGVIVGILLGVIAQYSIAEMLSLGITMSAVMVLIPKITGQFIEGLNPISKRSQELISSKLKGGRQLNIGMTPALVIGHPVTLVCSLLLVPIILFLSVIIPGNKFLPLASLSGLIYIFPLVLPYTKGNVLRSLLTGILTLVSGVWFATSLAPIFTKAVQVVNASLIPKGTSAVASIDFAASPFSWIVYQLTVNIGVTGAIILGIVTLGLAFFNHKKITQKLHTTEKHFPNVHTHA